MTSAKTFSAQKLMRSVERSSSVVKGADRVLEIMQRREIRSKLVREAERGLPPISIVSADLARAIGQDMKTLPLRQFAGRALRAILAEEGFEVAETGVRLGADKVFKVAATYRRSEPNSAATIFSSSEALLKAFARTLTEDEAAAVKLMLEARFPQLAGSSGKPKRLP